MKILFTIHDLQNYAGTETYTYTLIEELIKKGHEVFLYCSRLGKMYEKFMELKVEVTNDIRTLPKNIDIIHAQHRMEAYIAYTHYPDKPIIYMCHGVLPWQEQPLILPNVFIYVAVSEEVKNHLIKTYDIADEKIKIIRNGINLERFNSKRKVNYPPQKMLLISNRYTDEVKKVLKSTCDSMDMNLKIIGQSAQSVWNIEDEINEADIIVSLGRGILEAMSCGRIALVYDYNGGDGFVTFENYNKFKEKNFSGRTNKRKYSKDELIKEIKHVYKKDNIESNLELIKENHDIKKIADQFVDLYNNALLFSYSKSANINHDVIYEALKYIGQETVQKEKNTRYLKELSEEKNKIIFEKDDKLFELEKTLEENTRNLLKYENQLGSLNVLLKEKDEHLLREKSNIIKLKDALQMKNNELKNLEVEINDLKEEIGKVINDNGKLEIDNNELKKMISLKEDEIQRLINENKQKEMNTRYLLELTKEKNLELSEIYNSKSWKLIQKYRRLKYIAKRIMKDPRVVYRRITRRTNIDIQMKNNTSNKESNLVQISDKPLVSVVIPVYDRTKVLIESIESILNQTYTNFELIIVCDGSPYETLDILKNYENHPQVKIFKFFNNSGNAVRGRNKAIVEATGKYLAFQDSDDIAEKDRLEISVQYLEHHNVDVVYGGWRAKVDGSRNVDIRDNQEIHSPDCDYTLLLELCVPCQSTVMARVDALRAVGGLKTSMRYREDHELWLRMAYHGYKFKSIPHVLTNLRLHANNLELSYKESDDHWKSLMIDEHKKITKLKPKIAYVIPGCGISGGIAVICQHANRLLKRGYDVILITEDNNTAIEWFPNQLVQVITLKDAPSNLDIVIATGWSTAYTIQHINAKRKIYFVQSDESRFYPANSHESKKALESYHLPYEYMTEAKWIQKWLKENFNKDSYYVPNGLDEEIIYETEPMSPKGKKIRVLLEGPIDIPFKGMEDAFSAIKDLDCEVWCISSAGRPKEEWKCDMFFEKVPMDKMKQIYSSCDIFLKMSRIEGFFGPPLEMMACGGACVVGEVTGYDEYIQNGYNAIVVKQGDVRGAREAVKELIENQELRNELIRNGKETAKKWKWEPTIDILESIFIEK
ncbi:D-inositol-3-phosphate glycosyltransferase [Paenibacillus sp. CECT 9249]|uniref:glycosyltransferase n=1 Tax=Paenibacillus sp. CECT 9249 TaxID=2845385 RepID=UPI001E54BDAE|nr:glycosyltransferase [Paenibacillus sp. CECT 9249]CAH0122354.1 D-inositol-3-phosphate glycosyltransferase [Paenibacillus sp. CECT 9249]